MKEINWRWIGLILEKTDGCVPKTASMGTLRDSGEKAFAPLEELEAYAGSRFEANRKDLRQNSERGSKPSSLEGGDLLLPYAPFTRCRMYVEIVINDVKRFNHEIIVL